MTKKNTLTPVVPAGRLKKGIIKRKQMFNQLQTIHEEKINLNHHQSAMSIEDQVLLKIQEEPQLKLQKLQIGQQKTIQEVCEAVNQLMAKNKIGARNAFDVPIIDLFELINFKKSDTDNTWKTLSSTFQNDSKIYAYRVDAIHDIAYSILNIMSRRSTETQQKLKPELQKSIHSGLNKGEFADLKDSFLSNLQIEKTFLENEADKLNISVIECSIANDPTLQRTKRLFDQPGLKGMLLNSICVDKHLQLSLFSQLNHQAYSMKLTQLNEVDTKTIEHPLKKIKIEVDQVLGSSHNKIVTNKELEQVWANVKKGNITEWGEGGQKVWLDVQDPECRQNFDLMIDQNSENHGLFENIHRKSIGDFLRLKNPSKKIMNDQQMMIDGEMWLSSVDKKFLGIKSDGNLFQAEPIVKKVVRLADDVNFDDTEIQDPDEVLRKQSPTKQIHQEIEDRFLTTIRPSNEFKIQKILTLREEPQVELQAIQEEMAIQHDHEHFLEKQIDVKRQMTSIKETKDAIFSQLHTQSHTSFENIYENYCKQQGEISPALCFLTLLHLANERNLSFESSHNETDFLIKLPVS